MSEGVSENTTVRDAAADSQELRSDREPQIGPAGRHFLSLAAALLIGGVLVSLWDANEADRQMRQDAVGRVRSLADAMNVELLRTLAREGADADNPKYQRVRQQLDAARTLLPDCRSLQLEIRSPDGSVVAFADQSTDSHESDSQNASKTKRGTTTIVHRVFATGQLVVEGPTVDGDRAGLVVAVPIVQQVTDERVAVLSVILNADDWGQRILRTVLLPVLLTVFLVVIVVIGWILWRRRVRLGCDAGGRPCPLEPAVTLVVGLTISLFASVQASRNEAADHNEAFGTLARGRGSLVTQALHRVRDTGLESLARFYEGSTHVTAREFDDFCHFLEDDMAVYAWAWVSFVPASEKDDFEQRARAEDYQDYGIWEFGADGQSVPASARAMYYPVERVVPIDKNRHVLGLDFASEPRRRAAFELAQRTGLTSASHTITLVHDADELSAILVCRPVFHADGSGRLRGCAVAALRMQTLLTGSTVLDDSVLFDLSLVRPNGDRELLASSYDANTVPIVSHVVTLPVCAFGEVFLQTLHAGPLFEESHPDREGWLIGLMGVLISCAATVGTGMVCRRREQLEKLVAKRTHELSESNVRFNQLAEQSGTYHWEVDRDGRFTYASDVVETVTGYRPDELVGQKTLFDWHPDIGRDIFRAAVLAIFERRDNLVGLESPVQTKEGRVVWISTNGIPLLGEQGELLGYRGSDTDISDRTNAYDALKYAHEQLAESLDFSNSVFASMPIPVFVMDKEGRFIDCNRAFTQLHGLSSSEIRGKSPDQLWEGETGARRREAELHVLQEGASQQYITQIKSPSYGCRDVLVVENVVTNVRGEVVGIIGAHVDVTECTHPEASGNAPSDKP